MAIVRAVFLACGILCTSSQNIYMNENDDCSSDGETIEKIQRLQTTQRRIQETVDSLRQMVMRLNEDVTKTQEDVQIVKKGLNLNADCWEIFFTGVKPSGVYLIEPFGIETRMKVFCNMEVEGGGWTAIQRRLSGSTGFNRTWEEYKKGFGNPAGSYWIGNDVIHHLTKRNNSYLYVSITLKNGTTLYEIYHHFSVSDESENYRLYLGGPTTGTLGDRMLDTGNAPQNLSGMPFTTLDRDHDRWGKGNCAVDHGRGGGWWYNWCSWVNLNGPWSSLDWYMPWNPPLLNGSDITETLMMIKPH